MEVSECCDNVLQAAAQYQLQSNNSRLLSLLHHLEALETNTSKAAKLSQLVSSTDHLQLANCLTLLVSIIRENEESLLEKVLKVLINLSNEERIKTMLYDTLNVCPYVAALIETRHHEADDPALLDALLLLQKLTYGHRVKYDQSYVDSLLKLLINNVLLKVDSLIEPSLGILANLCRNNNLIQSAIRNMPLFRKLLKYLCSYFEHENKALLIFALSTFTSLTLQDREGLQFFLKDSNIERTLQTIFTIIKNGFRGGKWKYAADLLTDFFRNLQLQSCIIRYRYLNMCLNDVLSLLAAHSDEGIAEVFRLLLCLCSVPSIRKSINSRLFSPLVQGSMTRQNLRDSAQLPLNPESEPLLSCLHWAYQESGHGNQTSSLALEFISDSIQECLCDTDNQYPVHALIPVLTAILGRSVSVSTQISENAFVSLSQKIIQLTKLLKVMCSDPQCKAAFGNDRQISTEIFSAVLETHLSNKNLSHGLALSKLQSDSSWREVSAQCVLLVLDFAYSIHNQVSGLDHYVSTVLKDPRLFTFLSVGLASFDHNIISISLRLICLDLKSEMMQPDVDLCETIASNNKEKAASYPQSTSHEEESSILTSVKRKLDEDKENRCQPLSTSWSHKPESSSGSFSTDMDESALLNVIDRLKTGIESRDVKPVDVIDVFEHRIKAQQIREEHMNDLLDAKSQALAQADRLIAQLRGWQITHNAETSKLQGLLKEADRRNEKMVSEVNNMRISFEKLQAQLEKKLMDKGCKIEQLEKDNAELMEKCSELEETILCCNQKLHSVNQMKDDLQQAHEKLNEQYRVSCSQSKQLDEERKTLSKLVKEKDSSLQKLTSNLESLQEKFKCMDKEKTELENEKEEVESSVEKLRGQLNSSEKECKQLVQRVTMLDKVNQEQSVKLSEKTGRIQELEAELEKHSQIVSFINNLNLKK